MKLLTHDRRIHAWMAHMGQIWEPEGGREGAEAFQTAGEASELGEATAGSPIFVPVWCGARMPDALPNKRLCCIGTLKDPSNARLTKSVGGTTRDAAALGAVDASSMQSMVISI